MKVMGSDVKQFKSLEGFLESGKDYSSYGRFRNCFYLEIFNLFHGTNYIGTILQFFGQESTGSRYLFNLTLSDVKMVHQKVPKSDFQI